LALFGLMESLEVCDKLFDIRWHKEYDGT
jgi:hypothetical protein